jgi:hypothetical protein
MSAAANAAVLRRAIDDIWNAGNLDLGDAFFAPTYVNHLGLIGDVVRGPEAIKLSVALYRTAFPGLHVTVEDLVADDHNVALRWTTRIDSPNQEVTSVGDTPSTLTGLTLCRLTDGQIVESWTCWDAGPVLDRLSPVVERARGLQGRRNRDK